MVVFQGRPSKRAKKDNSFESEDQEEFKQEEEHEEMELEHENHSPDNVSDEVRIIQFISNMFM